MVWFFILFVVVFQITAVITIWFWTKFVQYVEVVDDDFDNSRVAFWERHVIDDDEWDDVKMNIDE